MKIGWKIFPSCPEIRFPRNRPIKSRTRHSSSTEKIYGSPSACRAFFPSPSPHSTRFDARNEPDRSIDRVHPNISPIFNSSNSIQFMRKNRVANRSVISSQFASWQTWISDISGDENFTANCPLRFLLFFRFNDCQGLFVTSRAV